jgi:TRAP-type C4-dicarboxylate transport system permease small subunit
MRVAPLAPLVRAIDRATNGLSRLNVALGSASGLSTMFLILIIVPDVIARSFFGFTIPFASEIAVLLLSCKIFLGLPGAQASRANYHVSFLTSHLPTGVSHAVRLISLALSLLLVSLLAWYVGQEAVRSVQNGEAIFVGANQFIVWPQRIVIAVGLALLTLQLIADLIREAAGLGNPMVKQEGGSALA